MDIILKEGKKKAALLFGSEETEHSNTVDLRLFLYIEITKELYYDYLQN